MGATVRKLLERDAEIRALREENARLQRALRVEYGQDLPSGWRHVGQGLFEHEDGVTMISRRTTEVVWYRWEPGRVRLQKRVTLSGPQAGVLAAMEKTSTWKGG